MSDDVKTPEEAAGAEPTAEKPENVSFDEIEEDNPTLGDTGALSEYTEDAEEKDLHAIYDIPVQVSAVLGRSNMQVSQLLKLGRGAVVELDRRVGEPIDVYVNNRLVARGEVVVVEDKLGITMTEIVKSES